MEHLSNRYEPKDTEERWYTRWEQAGNFRASPDKSKRPFTILMPPPNITGRLHMGHVLNNTLQDVLIRRSRMQGYASCWVPGTDHASIATEAKVVEHLAKQGIRKEDLSRSEFLTHLWAWKKTYGDIIIKQLRKLGVSCDWEKTYFTMDASHSESVQAVFIKLFNEGYLYRDTHMINWDPKAKTALSNEEVVHKEVAASLYYIQYPLVHEAGHVTIATTRPETILGDTALCVHPKDRRYKSLHGKQAKVPLVDREIPIICDEYVDKDFGTGCLKVTPAHDHNDYLLGQRHGLPSLNIFNEDGTIHEAGGRYVGADRFVVRKKIANELEKAGYLQKKEDIMHKVGFSERTHVAVEPRRSTQWFCKMKDLAKPALHCVMDDHVVFHPKKYKNTYRHWMENIEDWCISRQLHWGHRIPAWYDKKGHVVAARHMEEALQAFANKGLHLQPCDIQQDPDVLDTWFSSWLLPLSVFGGIVQPGNQAISYYYPTDVLVTAPEIIFFWVARMIISGHYYTKTPPFRHVYFTGIVRDKLRRKMSKSLGNSPDPLHMIATYGADGVRMGILMSAGAGNDLLFDEKLCLQGRNFCNKIWNALRLYTGWQRLSEKTPKIYQSHIVAWMEHRIEATRQALNKDFKAFRIMQAAMALYKLVWDDFCNRYLEVIKPVKDEPIPRLIHQTTLHLFERIVHLLHPFMPFITEEIWHRLAKRDKNLCVSSYPSTTKPVHAEEMTNVWKMIALVQEHKQTSVHIVAGMCVEAPSERKQFWQEVGTPIIERLTGISSLKKTSTHKYESYQDHMVENTAIRLFLVSRTGEDSQQECLDRQLEHLRKFLSQINAKFDNKGFVARAPQHIITMEEKKRKDTQNKIAFLEKEQLRRALDE